MEYKSSLISGSCGSSAIALPTSQPDSRDRKVPQLLDTIDTALNQLEKDISLLFSSFDPAVAPTAPSPTSGAGVPSNAKLPMSPLASSLSNIVDHINRIDAQIYGIINRVEL